MSQIISEITPFTLENCDNPVDRKNYQEYKNSCYMELLTEEVVEYCKFEEYPRKELRQLYDCPCDWSKFSYQLDNDKEFDTSYEKMKQFKNTPTNFIKELETYRQNHYLTSVRCLQLTWLIKSVELAIVRKELFNCID